jgi:Tfp pilus assembly protein PilN
MNYSLPSAINLASQPFRRERAQNALLTGIGAALLCSFLVLGSLFLHERAQAADLRRIIDTERTQLLQLQRQQAQFSTVLARPENADVFSRNVFLNELIARRAVSWTVVFRDLEKTLPPNMRLIGVRLPQVAGGDAEGTDRVQLDMVLGTDRPEVLIELLKRLERSELFGSAQVLGQQPPTQNDPLYKYRVTVTYAQKL